MPDYIVSLPRVIFNTLTIYFLLIAGFRLLGRRLLGQLTVIDFVVILVMGSAVETAMIDGNISLPAGLVSAATLLVANRIIARLAVNHKAFRRFVGGRTTLLIAQGHLLYEHLRRIGLTEEDVMAALRAHGYDGLDNISYAVMEDDGQISVVERGEKVIRTDKPIAAPKL